MLRRRTSYETSHDDVAEGFNGRSHPSDQELRRPQIEGQLRRCGQRRARGVLAACDAAAAAAAVTVTAGASSSGASVSGGTVHRDQVTATRSGMDIDSISGSSGASCLHRSVGAKPDQRKRAGSSFNDRMRSKRDEIYSVNVQTDGSDSNEPNEIADSARRIRHSRCSQKQRSSFELGAAHGTRRRPVDIRPPSQRDNVAELSPSPTPRRTGKKLQLHRRQSDGSVSPSGSAGRHERNAPSRSLSRYEAIGIANDADPPNGDLGIDSAGFSGCGNSDVSVAAATSCSESIPPKFDLERVFRDFGNSTSTVSSDPKERKKVRRRKKIVRKKTRSFSTPKFKSKVRAPVDEGTPKLRFEPPPIKEKLLYSNTICENRKSGEHQSHQDEDDNSESLCQEDDDVYDHFEAECDVIQAAVGSRPKLERRDCPKILIPSRSATAEKAYEELQEAAAKQGTPKSSVVWKSALGRHLRSFLHSPTGSDDLVKTNRKLRLEKCKADTVQVVDDDGTEPDEERQESDLSLKDVLGSADELDSYDEDGDVGDEISMHEGADDDLSELLDGFDDEDEYMDTGHWVTQQLRRLDEQECGEVIDSRHLVAQELRSLEESCSESDQDIPDVRDLASPSGDSVNERAVELKAGNGNGIKLVRNSKKLELTRNKFYSRALDNVKKVVELTRADSAKSKIPLLRPAEFKKVTLSKAEFVVKNCGITEDSPKKDNRNGALLLASCLAKQSGDDVETTPNSKKRRCVAPYMPPHMRRKIQEEAEWQVTKAEWNRRVLEEDANKQAVAPQPIPQPNVRVLIRKFESWLEERGECRMNELQKDPGVEIDEDGLVGVWKEHHGIWETAVADRSKRGLSKGSVCAGPGVKCLPVVAGGRYQFEVELLTDCAVVVGWSTAIALPSAFDKQAWGYASNGTITGTDSSDYGPQFGIAGDVIGALVQWINPNGRKADGNSTLSRGPFISFVLNGQDLGIAFDLSGPFGITALQPHFCQAWGQPFKVLFRGAKGDAPLKFPLPGFTAIGLVEEFHFCRFSEAVAMASNLKTAIALRKEHLQSFRVPDAHIVEIILNSRMSREMWLGSEEEDDEIALRMMQILGLGPWHSLGLEVDGWCHSLGSSCSTLMIARRTGRRTALASFRLRAHALQLVEISQRVANAVSVGFDQSGLSRTPVSRQMVLDVRKVFLRANRIDGAAKASRRLLKEWRGEDFRTPGEAPTVARRLIHGSLGLQMPLSHVSQEQHVRKLEAGPSADEKHVSGVNVTPATVRITMAPGRVSPSSSDHTEAPIAAAPTCMANHAKAALLRHGMWNSRV